MHNPSDEEMRATIMQQRKDEQAAFYRGNAAPGPGTIYTTSNRYFDIGGRPMHEYEQFKADDMIVRVPIYAYVHSGVAIKASINGNPFICPWDSGLCGYAVATRKDIQEWFGVKNVTSEVKVQMVDALIQQVEDAVEEAGL